MTARPGCGCAPSGTGSGRTSSVRCSRRSRPSGTVSARWPPSARSAASTSSRPCSPRSPSSAGSGSAASAPACCWPATPRHADIPLDAPGSGLMGCCSACWARPSASRSPRAAPGELTQALARPAAGQGRRDPHRRRGRSASRWSDGRAVAVRTADGERYAARRAVVADVLAPTLYTRLLDRATCPAGSRARCAPSSSTPAPSRWTGPWTGRSRGPAAPDRRPAPSTSPTRSSDMTVAMSQVQAGRDPGPAVHADRADDHLRPDPVARGHRVVLGLHARAAARDLATPATGRCAGSGTATTASGSPTGCRRGSSALAPGFGERVRARRVLGPARARGPRRQPGRRRDQRRHRPAAPAAGVPAGAGTGPRRDADPGPLPRLRVGAPGRRGARRLRQQRRPGRAWRTRGCAPGAPDVRSATIAACTTTSTAPPSTPPAGCPTTCRCGARPAASAASYHLADSCLVLDLPVGQPLWCPGGAPVSAARVGDAERAASPGRSAAPSASRRSSPASRCGRSSSASRASWPTGVTSRSAAAWTSRRARWRRCGWSASRTSRSAAARSAWSRSSATRCGDGSAEVGRAEEAARPGPGARLRGAPARPSTWPTSTPTRSTGTPRTAVFSVDGTEVRRCARPPAYPLQVMLAVFDFPEWSTGADEHLEPSLTIDWISHRQPPAEECHGSRAAC